MPRPFEETAELVEVGLLRIASLWPSRMLVQLVLKITSCVRCTSDMNESEPSKLKHTKSFMDLSITLHFAAPWGAVESLVEKV